MKSNNSLIEKLDELEEFVIKEKGIYNEIGIVSFTLSYNEFEPNNHSNIDIPAEYVKRILTYNDLLDDLYCCLFLDITQIDFTNITLDYLTTENNITGLIVDLEDGSKDLINIEWSTTFTKVVDSIYICMFKGRRI